MLPAMCAIELRHGFCFSVERRAHPLLGATANDEYRVKVGITESHEKSAAPSGWMMWLVSFLIDFVFPVEMLAYS